MAFFEETMAEFNRMVEYRRSAGFATATYECSIPPFIEYSAENHPDAEQITRAMVDEWLEHYPYKTNSTQAVFISMLRMFAGFINAQGKQAFIPDGDYSLKKERYHPYIFNDAELAALFDAIDGYQPYYGYRRRFRADIILPVLFRMMYCCGMRPAEPLRLHREDVDLSTGDIYIRRTKHNKERHIIMSDDMLALCRAYEPSIGSREMFFPHPDGGALKTAWMTYQFHACWNRSGLEKRGNPRPYDLRHAFATRTMMRWIDSGKDVMVLLPYLSMYLGHAEISSTAYYIHLLPDRIRKSSGINWDMFSTVYEEGAVMKKTKDPELFTAVADFLKVYAPVVRRKSQNTVKSYKCALNAYFDFLKETKQKTLFTAGSSDFTRDNILAFVEWLQKARGNEASTVNQRLAHIRTFCNYMMKNSLMSFGELSRINDIARIDDPRRNDFIFLDVDDVKLILQLPDTHTRAGIRDRFFIALLYDSGCRDQEILSLKMKDFIVSDPDAAELHVIGKGSKYRVTPVSSDVVGIFHQYCKAYQIDKNECRDEYIFTTRNTRKGGSKTKMSDDNVQRILKKYEALARESNPEIPHLHAHLFRRTRAMHLYMAGVDLTLIAEWLGHSNLETVQVYARATVDMKRKATAKLADDDHSVFKDNVAFKYSDDEDALKRLCGLK